MSDKNNKTPLDNEWDEMVGDQGPSPVKVDKGTGNAINNAAKQRLNNLQWEDDAPSTPQKNNQKTTNQQSPGSPSNPDILLKELMISLQKFCRPDKVELIKKQMNLVIASKVQQAIKEMKSRSMEW